MDPMILIFLSSGLFLGWSLGGNDSANVFGSAVGSRMIRFRTAAIICGVFVILGSVISGAGAAGGLGKLGAVNALAGSFTVALTAAVTVFWMTKLGLPVSTTQAVVGAIVGWNIFSGSITDLHALSRIVGTWVACPILGAVFAWVLYKLVVLIIRWSNVHMLSLDHYTRVGLILAGALGAYSLGANNIANVMGVFVPSSPFQDLDVGGVFTLTSVQQLFFVGAIAIAVGAFYSKKVMMTVGNSIMPVGPVAAWVVVVAQALVLLVFSSTSLQRFVTGLGLPPIPLIPVSSSQAVVGAVIGVGFAMGFRGARQIRWSVLLSIGSGWVSTPIIAAVVCFFLLFFMQNVFQQEVYREARYQLTPEAIEHLKAGGIGGEALADLAGQDIPRAVDFRAAVRERVELDGDDESLVLAAAKIDRTRIDPKKVEILGEFLSAERLEGLGRLSGQAFDHRWQLEKALAAASDAWRAKPGGASNEAYNKRLHDDLGRVLMSLPE